jgi:hypothetical protein
VPQIVDRLIGGGRPSGIQVNYTRILFSVDSLLCFNFLYVVKIKPIDRYACTTAQTKRFGSEDRVRFTVAPFIEIRFRVRNPQKHILHLRLPKIC